MNASMARTKNARIANADFRIKPCTTHVYPFVVFSEKNLLNPLNRKNLDGLAGFRKRAHNAGLRVRALNPLITIAALMDLKQIVCKAFP